MKKALPPLMFLFLICSIQAQVKPPQVLIGNQTWMLNNLNVDHYRNGDPIPEVKDPVKWKKLTTGAWCYYNNNPANGKIYGKLYNWYAINDPRGLAPAGWRVPDDSDWTNLIDPLGGSDEAGKKLMSKTRWVNPGSGVLNSSGFNAMPGGYRDENGAFSSLGTVGKWWNATWSSSTTSFARELDSSGELLWGDYYIQSGYAVRCIKE